MTVGAHSCSVFRIGTLAPEAGMFIAVAFGAGGVICLAIGMWFVRRQHRRRASTLAGWGGLALGAAQLTHAANSLTGDRQPLGLILAGCCAALSIVGYLLLARDRDTYRNGPRSRKRRKLPPIHP
ncbi:hypothetical protein OHB00_23640 [Streptomyces sp. NBC_00631]|uniref:hypothetical protein n=1 Tax=Streptomyces sp. NBC_00631 TaxID=2975793 RepID=UPI0030E4ACC2